MVVGGGGWVFLGYSGTRVSNASTPAAKQLYQLSMFGAAAADVTYGQLLAAFPGISARCP